MEAPLLKDIGKDLKILLLRSGGYCAFPTCDKYLVAAETESDAPVVLGQIAHIVARSGKGPRASAEFPKEDLNCYPNLILLCGEHHKLIDDQPNTYTVRVLREMKARHEGKMVKESAKPDPQSNYEKEKVHTSLLRVSHLPKIVFAAPCGFEPGQDSNVKQYISYPADKKQLIPFLLREQKLFCFHDLREPNNPFNVIVDKKKIELFKAQDMWAGDDSRRQYIALLNKGLFKYTSRLDVAYDPAHKRFYFKVLQKGLPRTVRYRTLTNRKSERNVVWNPMIRKTQTLKKFWWHLAAGIQFQQLGDLQWGLTIRPERHITQDGEIPFPSDYVGRKVTKIKAKMYNNLYLTEVNFWRDFLSQGNPRIILNFGDQSAVIEKELLPFEIEWPGISGDRTPFDSQKSPDDLFTLAEFSEAISGEEAA